MIRSVATRIRFFSISNVVQNLRSKQIQRAANKEIRTNLNPERAKSRAKWDYFSQIGSALDASKHQRVLELGCGPGKYASLLGAMGFKVTAVDPCTFSDWKDISVLGNVSFQANVFAESLPFEDASFDAVACMGALLYFQQPLLALREVRRVLRANGRLIVRTPNRSNYYTLNTGRKLDPASVSLHTMEELKALIQSAGFKIVSERSYGYWPPYLTDTWWYISRVWLPIWAQDFLSFLTPQAHRLLNTVVADKEESVQQ